MLNIRTQSLSLACPPTFKNQRRPTCCPRAFPKTNEAHYKESKKAILTHESQNRRRCEYFDLHEVLVPYKEAWNWQKSMIRKRLALVDMDVDPSDMLLVLQHYPVYTMGTGSSEDFLKFDIESAPYAIYRTERGGEVTYHGPGQLVMYPILNLRHHKMDLHWYLRSLEEIVIRMLSRTFSIKASRQEGFTGVWVGNQKLAAIGIRVTRWMTYHGLALNVDSDLMPFQHIVPCGIHDREVGSISGLLGDTNYVNLMNATCEALLKEFSEVFQLGLVQGSLSDLGFLKDIETYSSSVD